MPFVRFIGSVIATLAAGTVIVFTCWILAAGCSRAHIAVTNQSGTTLSNLVISGSCKERRANTLVSQSAWRTVTPYESGMMRFTFDSAGISYSTNTEVNAGFLAVFYMVSSNMMITVQKKG